jgi:hypothetical protein
MVLRQNYSSRQPGDNYARTRVDDNSSDAIHESVPTHGSSLRRARVPDGGIAGVLAAALPAWRLSPTTVAPLHLVPE